MPVSPRGSLNKRPNNRRMGPTQKDLPFLQKVQKEQGALD